MVGPVSGGPGPTRRALNVMVPGRFVVNVTEFVSDEMALVTSSRLRCMLFRLHR